MPSTRMMWAGRIFEQWKCIRNYKLKQQGTDLDRIISGSLLTLEIPELSEALSYFIMEIHKQSGEEYPRETLYKIVMSIQHFMSMNGRDLKLLKHPGLIQMRNTLDNQMKELSKKGIIRDCQQSQPISIEDEERMW